MVLIVLAVAVIIILAAIRKVYDKFWSKSLTATVHFRDAAAFQGDKTELVEVIVNDKILPIPTLEIDFNLNRRLRFTDASNSTVSDKLYRRDVFSLGGRKKITRRLELLCRKRGYFTIDGLGLMANDLFMSKKYLTSFKLFDEMYVYPGRISTERISIPFNKIMGELLSRQRIYDDPFEFGGIRDYMISDPMKYVNWKASAKSGKLVVNLHDSSLSQRITLILDTYDNTGPVDDELNEEAIRIASALSERIMAAGISLSITGNGMDLQSFEKLSLNDIKGSSILVKKKLSRLMWDDKEKIAAVIGEMKREDSTLYVLISKNVREDTAEAFYRLCGKEEGLWVLPYKDERPEVAANGFRVLYWEADQCKT